MFRKFVYLDDVTIGTACYRVLAPTVCTPGVTFRAYHPRSSRFPRPYRQPHRLERVPERINNRIGTLATSFSRPSKEKEEPRYHWLFDDNAVALTEEHALERLYAMNAPQTEPHCARRAA